MLVSGFSCHEHQEGAEQDMGGSSGQGLSCPVLAMQFLLVKDVQQLGLR